MPLPSPPTPGSLSFSALRSRRLEIDDDPLALFEQSLREGWGDGLPLLPATEPRVLELAASAKRTDGEQRLGLGTGNAARAQFILCSSGVILALPASCGL